MHHQGFQARQPDQGQYQDQAYQGYHPTQTYQGYYPTQAYQGHYPGQAFSNDWMSTGEHPPMFGGPQRHIEGQAPQRTQQGQDNQGNAAGRVDSSTATSTNWFPDELCPPEDSPKDA